MKSLSALSAAVLSALCSTVLAQTGLPPASTLTQVTADIGPNPNNVGMFVYAPATVATNPPLIVAIHYCTGSAQAYFTGTQYANLAEQHGFIVIYPDSPRSGKCFDVNTDATLTHDGGGDSQGIASMIQFAIDNYGVDASRVFVTGSSSGGMSFIRILSVFKIDLLFYSENSYDDKRHGWVIS